MLNSYKFSGSSTGDRFAGGLIVYAMESAIDETHTKGNQYIRSDIDYKRRLIGSIFPEKFQFQQKKVRTADINPILHKMAQFNRVNKRNKKRDKSK